MYIFWTDSFRLLFFSFSELKTHAKNCIEENNFKELEPISIMLSNMCNNDFIVITSQ